MDANELSRLYAAGRKDFGPIILNEANLRNINLSGANLSGASLNVANLSGANLSGANLNRAKLNVARLSAANLSGAKLNRASLNVANLIRADLGQAELVEALIVRAELVRAELSGANLSGANLSNTDLREATLRQTNLSYCNLNEANLRDACLTEANLEQAILNGADLSRTDLRGANLRGADLSQVILGRANLGGADLRGANLRWTDLSGADLRWADLSEAKLSGANLLAADLRYANLVNASLVHADLSKTRLTKIEWMGADLTGATLTGAKFYNVSRFGLKTGGIKCDWIDLSREGDLSEVYRLTPEQVQQFFNETPPTIQVTIDAPFNLYANLALATIYHQITQAYPTVNKPPNIKTSSRRTYLTFQVESNEQLFIVAYCATLPFKDTHIIERYLIALLNMLVLQVKGEFTQQQYQQIRELTIALKDAIERLRSIKNEKKNFLPLEALNFLKSPTYTAITNSHNKTIDLYHNPEFGKRFLQKDLLMNNANDLGIDKSKVILPPDNIIIQFIQDFFYELEPLNRS